MSGEFSDDIVQEFVADSQEMLDQIEPQLIEMTKGIADGTVDDQLINSIFRLFHSIKGGAGFLNFNTIQKVTHEGETLLDMLRKGEMQLTPRHVDLMVSTADFLRGLLHRVEMQLNDSGAEEDATTVMKELSKAILDGGSKFAEIMGEQTIEPDDAIEKDSEVVREMEVTADMKSNFVRETTELLDEIEQMIIALEKDPGSGDLVENIFRCIHTVKGNCGFFGYSDMEKLAHSAETALDFARTNPGKFDKDFSRIFLSVIDSLRKALKGISENEDGEIKELLVFTKFLGELVDKHKNSGKKKNKSKSDKEQEDINIDLDAGLNILMSDDTGSARTSSKDVPEPGREFETGTYDRRATDRKNSGRQDIRVDLKKLDALMELVGELIVAENMVIQNPDLEGYEFESFEKASLHLHKITRDLQDITMSIRMIPVSNTFRKMIRLVHDLSQKVGKEVELNLVGEDTEVDKTVIELISDPLVHIVRNAIDHGLESPEKRKLAGKNPKGTITIQASHEGEEVLIAVTDDGRGLDKKKILKKGIERGLVSGDGSNLSDDDIYKLVFEPGFSTADNVSDISGRGVGMDVVKRNLEKIKGRVEIKSTPGTGSKFTIRIPLTLAIIEGMLVKIGDSSYTIPLLAIRESIRPNPSQITLVDGEEVVNLRGKFLPIIRLGELHRVKANKENLHEGILVIVDFQEMNFAIFVDSLIGQQQTVIKGLPGYMKDVRGVSGCTILGNGDVSLVLDVGTLWSITEKRKRTPDETKSLEYV
ncbi:MAG: chemotaxis protein CheA [Nitrospinota bacterium]|nr:chemotaxis protein CheA [Nitrospinota bacterium]